MRRVSCFGLAVVSFLAMAATGAGSAAAFKPPLRLEESGVLLTTGGAFSGSGTDNVSFTIPGGNIDCDALKGNQGGVAGQDQTWLEPTDRLEIKTTSGPIGNEFPASRPPCTNTTELGKTVLIYGEGLPWTLAVSFSKKAELKSIESALFFDMYFENGVQCTFISAALKGTNTQTFPRSPLEVTFQKQKLKLQQGSEAACPKSATINLALTTFSGPEGGLLEQE
jgi:hypothetical protein